MKQVWTRLGRIYEPGMLPDLGLGHGLMPVAEHLSESCYRVYFAGRDTAKRSHICSFDFNLATREITDFERSPLISPGAMGTFDENGCVPSWLVSFNGRKHLYYVGWNTGGSVPFRLAVGLAIACDDGKFEKVSQGPIADRSPADPCLVGSCGGIIENDHWHIWYVSGVSWHMHDNQPRHRYHLKYADSDDGIRWNREGLVAIDFANEMEYAFASPRILKDEDRYRMWYCFRGDAYAIGYAESTDGQKWQRLDDVVKFEGPDEDWESGMKCYPYVFKANGQTFMLYNGNGYGESGIGLAILNEP